MQDQALIETRASVYWWFSTLLSKELSKDQFNAYINQSGVSFLDELAMESRLKADVAAIKQSLAKLNVHKHPYLEYRLEFAQLFLSDSNNGAPPYASIYLSADKLMFEQAHDEMVALLAKQGLTLNDDFNEPADHIAIQLDYLGNLVLLSLKSPNITHEIQQQLNFIETRLLNWLPLLIAKMTYISNSGLYQSICLLLHSYLLLDIEMLKQHRSTL